MKSKPGPEAAVKTTRTSSQRLYYIMVNNQVKYDETIWEAWDAQREKDWKQLTGRATRLGYELVAIGPA